MQRLALTTTAAAGIALLAVGCAGPEEKLGRGFRNFTEFARMGEMSRAVEQTALWEGPTKAYTTGVIRGFNRTVARSAIGLAEMLTFPIPAPDYEPWLKNAEVYPDPSVATLDYPWGGLVLPEGVVYPSSYRPALLDDALFHPNTAIGFGGGDVLPFLPGSRFKVFDH